MHTKVLNPDFPSPYENWENPSSIASTIPRHSGVPDSLYGVDFLTLSPPSSWNDIEGQGSFDEPPKPSRKTGLRLASGVITIEPDGRIWVVHPTNQYGGYKATFPKGTLDNDVANLRVNAIKETYEETGLLVKLVGYLGDYERTTSITRYYIGVRTGGHPSYMGWETQKVSLVPPTLLREVASHVMDEPVINDLMKRI